MAVQEKYPRTLAQDIVYPDSDGKPMADNTLQALWIIILYDNLRGLLAGQDVLIAADLFWYPVEGDPYTKVAPDVLVALGRPDGYRGSYKQWKEDNQPPQVVFEVLSPSNSAMEMLSKLDFYERYGVSEFVLIDPEKNEFIAYQAEKGKLIRTAKVGETWKSPLLGIQFVEEEGKLQVRNPDGTPFKTFAELKAEKEALKAEKEILMTEKEVLKVEKEALKAEKDESEAARDAALLEVERFKARLRELGEDLE